MDIEFVYNALLHYTDSLEKFRSWFDRYGINGNDEDVKQAKTNIDEEIAQYRELQLDICNKCFSDPLVQSVRQTRIRNYV